MINKYDIERLLLITKSTSLIDIKNTIRSQLEKSLHIYTTYSKKEELNFWLKRFVRHLIIYKVFLDIENKNEFILSKLRMMKEIRSKIDVLGVVKNKESGTMIVLEHILSLLLNDLEKEIIKVETLIKLNSKISLDELVNSLEYPFLYQSDRITEAEMLLIQS